MNKKIAISDYCHVELTDNSQDFILLFSGANTTKGKFNYYKSFSSLNVNKIYLNCRPEDYYHKGVPGVGECLNTTLNFLKNMIGSEGNVYTFGCSMGGYGALVYGSLLNAEMILAFGASTPLTSEFINENRASHIKIWNDLAPSVLGSKAKKFIFYGDSTFNDLASYSIFSQSNNVVSELYMMAAHALVVPLSQRVKFDTLFCEFKDGKRRDLSEWFHRYELTEIDRDLIRNELDAEEGSLPEHAACHPVNAYILACRKKQQGYLEEAANLYFKSLETGFNLRSIKRLFDMNLSLDDTKKLFVLIQRNIGRNILASLDYSEKSDLHEIYQSLFKKLEQANKTMKIERDNIEGYFDRFDGKKIYGWCCNHDLENTSVLIDLANGTRVESIADNFRPDLQKSQKNNGYCGFSQQYDVYSPGAIDFESLNIISVSESQTTLPLLRSGD
ncbi:hypothetical protein [Vibrio mexicanus]|uniref:hypothetical protein n=1 Tax=Vibrio mexicanus TaxID=1004326 RepID=UPI00063C62ED|nr:hypothetical protein [Vibrio mexicanus]